MIFRVPEVGAGELGRRAFGDRVLRSSHLSLNGSAQQGQAGQAHWLFHFRPCCCAEEGADFYIHLSDPYRRKENKRTVLRAHISAAS